MDPAPEETHRLRRLVRDLVALSALPAVWVGFAPAQIADSLAGVLVKTLHLDLLYLRLKNQEGGVVHEIARTAASPLPADRTREVGQALGPLEMFDGSGPAPVIVNPVGGGELRVAVVPLGHGGQAGVVVAGSPRADFPTEAERLLLQVGTNQAASLAREKEAGQIILSQREQLRITLASIGDAVVVTDAAGRVRSLNAAAEALTGWTEAEAAGQPLGKVFHILNEQTRQAVESPVGRVLREGVVVGLGNHTMLVARDGTERPIDDSAAPVRDAGGNISGVVLIFRDVTEKRQAEKTLEERANLAAFGAEVGVALTQSDTLRESLFRCAEVMVRRLDGAFARVWTRNEAAEVLELQASAGLYTHIDGPHSRVPVGKYKIGLIAQERQPHLTNSVAEDARVSDPEWARREGMVAFAGFPLLVGDRLVGVMAMFARHALSAAALEAMRSVANGVALGVERRQAEERLREATRVAETLNRIGGLVAAELDTQVLVQTVTDEATRITDARFGAFFYNVRDERGESYTLYTISGVPREAFERFPMPRNTAIFEPTFRGRGVLRLEDVTKDFRYGHNDPYYGMPEGHLPVRSYLAVPVVSRSGEVLGGLFFGHPEAGVFSEWDERLVVGVAAQAAVAIDNARLYQEARNAGEQLRQKNAELAAASRHKDEFLAMLAHELRNPLAPIRNALHVLQGPRGNGDVAVRATEMMARQVDNLVRLVDDLMDVSRITRGKVKLETGPLALSVAVQGAVETARPLIDAQGHRLTLDVSDEPVLVEADRTRLEQVIANLLNNAAKYTERGGNIRLGAGREGGEAVVRVRDTGMGIAADLLPRVFDLFTQAERSLDRSQGGLGIGLALVKKLVEMHGGTVEARSDGPGQGSEFVVRLPALAETTVRAEAKAAFTPPVGGDCRRRVLLVDDNADARESLAMLLRLWGHEVRPVPDGTAALEEAQRFRPDVVLLDIGLPGLSGYEVARRLRRLPGLAGALLVAVSGYGQEEDRRKSQEAGIDNHLVKPADPAAVQVLLASFDSPERRAARR